MVQGSAKRRRGALTTLLGVVAVLLGLAAWALASPVGASPDEDYHLISIWCGQGIRPGVCEAGPDTASRRVPYALTKAACYAFDPTQSGACQSAAFGATDHRMVTTERGNFTGDYPPVFYWVMSHLVGPGISTSVVTMRAASALLFVLLVGGTAVLVPTGLRRGLVAGFVVSSVPLGVFVIASINPSGWALLSAPVLFVTTLGYLTTNDRRRRWGLGALAALALLVGAGARADAAVYGVVAIGAAVVYVARLDWAYLRRIVYPAILGVVAGWAYLSAGQSSAATAVPPKGPHGPWRIIDLVLNVPTLWTGALGGWGLGWLDTAMPALVWVAGWGAFAAMLFVAGAYPGRRRAVAVGLIALAVWFVPTYIQYLSGEPVGSDVQPRYVLPLLALLATVLIVRTGGAALRLTHGQWWTVVLALGSSNAVALFYNIRRYVTGIDLPSPDLDRRVEWWWGLIPLPPLAVWAIGSVAFVVGVALVTRELTSRPPLHANAPKAAREHNGGAELDGAPDAPGSDEQSTQLSTRPA